MNTTEKVFVTGHKVTKFDSIVVIVKDNYNRKNPLAKIKVNKTGSIFMNTGVTMEEAMEAYPKGSVVLGAQWGDEEPSQFGGIYTVMLDEDDAAETTVSSKAVLAPEDKASEPIDELADTEQEQ